jgi:preprotein translocase subunit SecD
MTKFHWKVLIIVLSLAASFYYLAPSLYWYSLSPQKREDLLSRRDPMTSRILNLGLDLQGGMRLLLELDATNLPNLDPKTVTEAIEQNIIVIRNRVDSLGVREPLIVREGDRWVAIQLPGVKESRQAKEILGKTALLEFKIVEGEEALPDIEQKLRELAVTNEQIQKKQIPEAVQKLVPPGLELAPSHEGGVLLVRSKTEMTGANLTSARVELGGNYSGYPVVAFEFNPEGARDFDAITAANVQKRMAIVLDGIVQSAPVIRSRISGGRGVIEGTFTPEDASLLANVLNSGALKAPMTIIQEQIVGPTLGEDSIRAGLLSCGLGVLAVFLFMVINYKISGLLADSAVIFNLLLLLAGMAMLHATLTLPGIAGIILSLAMAVDANVLICERMKEEIRAGKTMRFVMEEGYHRAFPAILDGHVTEMIAAVFLFQFGTEAIKGFGVTLLLGLAASLFTAITATKTAYESWMNLFNPKRLSI